MAGSSANLGALNSEWTDLAGKIGAAFYSPGSATDVAARRAQNGQDGSVVEQPVAPPVVVGKTPAAPVATPAAPAAPAAPAVVPADKYDNTVKLALMSSVSPQRGVYNDFNTPGVTREGPAPQAAAAVAKPTVPTMNAPLLEQQQNLMSQIAAAQQVVSAGSNRDGYKMGDVTKGIATMQALSPLVASTNNLLGATYGTDAGIINHTADNAARMNIASAGNATELAKADLSGQYGVLGHQLTAQANSQLAQQKAALEAGTPAGQKALVEAEIARFRLNNAKMGNVGANLALEGKQDVQQVKSGMTGNLAGVLVNGKLMPLVGDDATTFNPPPPKKK